MQLTESQPLIVILLKVFNLIYTCDQKLVNPLDILCNTQSAISVGYIMASAYMECLNDKFLMVFQWINVRLMCI